MWANTVLATSGHVLAVVVYTGKETRTEMNSKEARVKMGKFDLEVNRLSQILFVFMIVLALGIVALDKFRG